MTQQGPAAGKPPTAGAGADPDLLHALYAAALEPDAWLRIMRLIAPVFRADKAMFVRLERTCPSESVHLSIGVGPELLAAMRARNPDDDLVWRAAIAQPTGSAFRVSDLVPMDAFRRGPLYQRIAVPGGFEYALIGILENTSAHFTTVNILRGEQDFSAGEVAQLAALVPHLQTIQHIQRRIALGDAGRREALLSFDRAHQPVVVLDRSGYAIYVNGDARRALKPPNGCSLKHGRLHFHSLTQQTEFERLVQLALAHGPEGEAPAADGFPQSYEIRVPRLGPGAPLALSLLPISRSGDRAVLPDGAACLVLVFDLETPNPLPVSRLAWLYRLTTAEARVCESLFRVGSVDAVAEDLHLTRNTVRSHLKNIYAKFGIATQGQLMQRLATSLRLVSSISEQGAPD